MIWFAVAVGAILGAFGRFYLSSLGDTLPRGIPWGTLICNLLGCFLIGLFSEGFREGSGLAKGFLITGVLGCLTTFSTFIWQFLRLFQEKTYFIAISYWGLSNVGGICCCLVGYYVGKHWSFAVRL